MRRRTNWINTIRMEKAPNSAHPVHFVHPVHLSRLETTGKLSDNKGRMKSATARKPLGEAAGAPGGGPAFLLRALVRAKPPLSRN